MKTLMVQGTSSGAGKSTLVTALCRIFSDRGLSVAPFKSQNMSNFSYTGDGFEISRAQAVQAVAARAPIIPEMNPILLKPRGEYNSMVYVYGKPIRMMHASYYYSSFAGTEGIRAAMAALQKLRVENDLVIIEGAGSPAEINIPCDIANMTIASRVHSPVLLVADIDRGGAFASITGTLSLLAPGERELVRGLIFNKFRGDEEILKPGIVKLERMTRKRFLGVIPKIKIEIPDEDSLDAGLKEFSWTRESIQTLEREIEELGRLVAGHLDMDALEKLIR